MNTVLKYALNVPPTEPTQMPKGARILHVGPSAIDEVVFLWALACPDEPDEPRMLHITGTGHIVEDHWRHVGTVQAKFHVWHVWEGAQVDGA